MPSGDLLDAVLALPKHLVQVEADCFPLMTPIGEGSTRAVCPRHFVLMDAYTEEIIANKVLTPSEGKSWTVTKAFPAFLEMLVQIGYRPTVIAFARDITTAGFSALCDLLGIEIADSPCDLFYDYRDALEEMLEKDPPE